MSNFEEIQTLRTGIFNEICTRKGKNENVFDHLVIKSLEVIAERLNKIEKALKVDKYSLVFIGEVGSGKTTAICRLLDLVFEKEKNIKNKPTKVITNIMQTTSGRTTICEVVVDSSQQNYLEIEPYSEDDLSELIKSLCYYVWLKNYPHLTVEGEITDPLPAELRRAIINITDLKAPSDYQEFDYFTKLANDFSENQFQQFYQEVINRAKLSERTETKIVIPLNDDLDQVKSEIHKNFLSLNLGQLSNFSIPRRIYVKLDESVLDLKIFARVKNIIDTRGIDVGQSRPDLESYIREQEGAICIFTDRFNAAPTAAVVEIISRYLTPESQDIASKLIHMVLPRRGEPEDVMGAENRDEGIKIKKGQISIAFERLNFLPENMLFYDAFQHHLPDGRLNSMDYTCDDVHADRQRVCKEINQIILQRETVLWQEVEFLNRKINEIKQGKGLNKLDDELVKNAREKVKKYGFLNIPKGNIFISKYLDLLGMRHAMTLRATNNRFGVYEPRDIDIYFDSAQVAEQISREIMESPKDKIMDIITDLKENASNVSGLKPMVASFEIQINTLYEALVIEIGRSTMETVKESLSSLTRSNPFWVQLQDRFGKGSGFKADVLSMYADKLEEIDDYFNEVCQNLWEEKLVKKIVEFFG